MNAETIAANVASAREQDARAATVRASDFITVCIEMLEHEDLSPASRALWDAGMQLLGDEQSTQTRIGFALALDALAQSPEALVRIAADLRGMLVDTAPGLEGLKR